MLKDFYGSKILKETSLREIDDVTYSKITPDMRVHMTRFDEPRFPSSLVQESGHKPIGLWYGIGTEWVDWVRSEMPEWESDNMFELILDESRLLKIETPEELEEFTMDYKDAPAAAKGIVRSIHWDAVSKAGYAGIEISPYQWDMRMNRLTTWYYGWDVASGCIWDKRAIREIRKI